MADATDTPHAGGIAAASDTPRAGAIGDGAQVVLANLLRPLLLELARTMPATPRELLASGLLVEEVDEVVEAFARRGLRERERRHSGEWSAVWLTVPRG